MSGRKIPHRGNRRLFLIIGAALISLALIVAFLPPAPHGHGSTTSQSASQSTHVSTTTQSSHASSTLKTSATYVTSSAPNSSQWLIVNSMFSPVSVSANNTGAIQKYTSLSLLNQTRIGYYCVSTESSGACAQFEQFFETGWFWDSSNQILYVHYAGGPAVEISVYTQSG